MWVFPGTVREGSIPESLVDTSRGLMGIRLLPETSSAENVTIYYGETQLSYSKSPRLSQPCNGRASQ